MIQPEDWIPRTLVTQWCFQRIMHCLLECLSSLGRCTRVKRKLQKFLGLELGNNTESHRITLFYLVVKTLTFWSRLSTAFGCKQVCNVKMLGHGEDAESCIHHTSLFSLSWALNKASAREFLFQGVWKNLRKQWVFIANVWGKQFSSSSSVLIMYYYSVVWNNMCISPKQELKFWEIWRHCW